jgi:hypothetical protein
MRFTTHDKGLLYFTNYHTHDYENFRLYNKTLRESKTAQQEGIYWPKSGAHRLEAPT